jgi:hypothetical protein
MWSQEGLSHGQCRAVVEAAGADAVGDRAAPGRRRNIDARVVDAYRGIRPIGLVETDVSVNAGGSMRVAKDEVDVRMAVPGVVIRQRGDFGTVRGFDRISGEYFTLAAGVDTTPIFEGLEGNLCPCPHWGFILSGEVTTTDADGIKETVRTHDLFYWPPGHNVRVDADAEIVMFSPQHEHTQVIDHMMAMLSG